MFPDMASGDPFKLALGPLDILQHFAIQDVPISSCTFSAPDPESAISLGEIGILKTRSAH